MPFEDGEFQLVVSSFVPREIGIPDPTDLFRESIRVLSPGCIFMIVDVFNALKKAYKVEDMSELLEKIEGLGVENAGHKSMKEASVRLGGMAHVWKIGYISGRKSAKL